MGHAMTESTDGAGGLKIGSGGKLTVTDATLIFSSNTTDATSSLTRQAGTALGFAGDAQASILRSTFTFDNDVAKYAGAALQISGTSYVDVKYSYMSFYNERVGTDGGAIRMYNGGKINVEFSTYVMSFNYSGGYGGAMYIFTNGTRTSMTFTNSYVLFSSNSAGTYGGGLSFFGVYDGGLVIRRSIVDFIGNVAVAGGGAITAFNAGTANADGGNKEFTIEDSVVNFSSNGVSGAASTNGGGAISFFDPTTFIVRRSTIIFSANWLNPAATSARGLSIYQVPVASPYTAVITANYLYSDVEFSNHNYTPETKSIIYVTGTNVMLTFGVLGDAGTAGTVRFTSNTSTSYGRMWWGSAVNSVNFYAVSIVARFNSATGTGNGNGGGFFYTGQGATNNNYTVNIGGVNVPSNFLFRRGADISSNTSASDGGAIL
jgi:hypothetical protein